MGVAGAEWLGGVGPGEGGRRSGTAGVAVCVAPETQGEVEASYGVAEDMSVANERELSKFKGVCVMAGVGIVVVVVIGILRVR